MVQHRQAAVLQNFHTAPWSCLKKKSVLVPHSLHISVCLIFVVITAAPLPHCNHSVSAWHVWNHKIFGEKWVGGDCCFVLAIARGGGVVVLFWPLHAGLYVVFSFGQIFYVSRCTLKTANKQYSNLKNDYEMTFNNDTVIEKCEEEVDLPCMTFDFVPINEMEKHQANSIVGK